MADELARILARYGEGYSPDLGGDDIYSTADVRRRMEAPVSRWPVRALRGLASYIPTDDRESNKRGPDECWGWKAQKRWDGYGRFVTKRRPMWAHRVSYELHFGQIPKGMHVLHSCDCPECTNPKHLRLGTHVENMIDKNRRGRDPIAKLTPEQVREIRKLLGTDSEAKIGARFGVKHGVINDIAKREPYQWVE